MEHDLAAEVERILIERGQGHIYCQHFGHGGGDYRWDRHDGVEDRVCLRCGEVIETFQWVRGTSNMVSDGRYVRID